MFVKKKKRGDTQFCCRYDHCVNTKIRIPNHSTRKNESTPGKILKF